MERAHVVVTFYFLFFSSFYASTAMHVNRDAPTVHIVFVDQPDGVEAEAFHLKTLASVLGSEEAAKKALVYSYQSALKGFSARLTPQQVSELSKQPGVLKVMPSTLYKLHSKPGKLHDAGLL